MTVLPAPLATSPAPLTTLTGHTDSRAQDFAQRYQQAQQHASPAAARQHPNGSKSGQPAAAASSPGPNTSTETAHNTPPATAKSAASKRSQPPSTDQDQDQDQTEQAATAPLQAIPWLDLLGLNGLAPSTLSSATPNAASASTGSDAPAAASRSGLAMADLAAATSADTPASSSGSELSASAQIASSPLDLSSAQAFNGTLAESLGSTSSRAEHVNDAALASLQANPPTTPVALASQAPLVSPAPPVQPDQPAFASQLGQHLSVLVQQDVQQARIQVSPPGLGPIDIQLHVGDGVVDVQFAVQHPAMVHAIQQTLPQLDSLMSSQGLQLGQTQVATADTLAGQQQADPQHHPDQAYGRADDTSDRALDRSETITTPTQLAALNRSLIDHFV